MKESLYDKYVDENGVVDFGRSGGMSQQKEAKRFLNALNKQSELLRKDCFSVSVRSPLKNSSIYLDLIEKTRARVIISIIISSGNIQFGR